MYENILVPLDGSEMAECVLPHVESIARGCKVPNVTFISVIEPYLGGGVDWSFPNQQWLEQQKANAETYLRKVADRLNHDGVNFEIKVLIGLVVNTLIEYVEKNPIDLVIIATHGRSGISRWVWGSTADRILRSACVPVLMVRAPGCIRGI